MELQLNRKATVMAVDNTAIITKKNGSADLLFIQLIEEGPAPKGDVVAAIRLTTMRDLEDLKNTIEESITKHKNAEK